MLRLAIALLVAFTAWPAAAQPAEVEIAAEQTYSHAASSMAFPPSIGEFVRQRVVRFNGENDLSGTYERADKRVWISIYLTRVGTPDPSLWFDRVAHVVQARDGFHPAADADVAAVPFVAPGFDRPSGLKVAYAVEPGGSVMSTGVALAAYGTYLLKLRMSSDRLSQPELADTLTAFLASMPAPKALGNEPAPYIVAACPDALTFDKKAKQRDAEIGEGLMLAVMAGGIGDVVDEDGEPSTAVPQPTYCRDPSSTQALAIYRPDATTNGYLISYDDTGSAVVIGGGGACVFDVLSNADDRRKRGQSYPLIHQTPDGNTVYRPFKSLPSPQAALEVPGNQNPVAKSDRDKNIEIFTQ